MLLQTVSFIQICVRAVGCISIHNSSLCKKRSNKFISYRCDERRRSQTYTMLFIHTKHQTYSKSPIFPKSNIVINLPCNQINLQYKNKNKSLCHENRQVENFISHVSLIFQMGNFIFCQPANFLYTIWTIMTGFHRTDVARCTD